nr:MAG TPA: Intron-binding protein aquarius N-terminus [Caudoviricetes sp.]DAI85393.1 MAG TPA: Intron-binding protein aquarius N-terminus [Caudoviricetes sp.]
MLKVISFTRTVADALGAIFGWTIEISGRGATADGMEDIADGVGDIGDNADSSNKKAQKLKKTLLSIDEIHALDDNSDSGSGGGSGSGGSGGGGAGSGVDSSLKKTDGLLEKYKSSIKDLYSLGKYIGDAIADSLNSINWDNVYQSASNFGKGLADFLNGLISPKLFTALGKTIAGSIRTAIVFAFSFTSTFDWGNLGDSFASFINGALHEMSRVSDVTGLTGWQELGKTVNNIVHGIRDTLIHALINIDWKDAFKGISEFIGELDIDTFTILIGAFAWKHGLKEITKTLITSEWEKYATAKGLSKTELALRGVEVLVIVSSINYVLAHMKGWIDKLKEWFKSPESGMGISDEVTGFDGKKIKLVTPLEWRIKEIKWKIKDAEKSVDDFFKDLGNYFKKGWKTFKKNMSLNVDDLQNVLGPQLYNGFVGIINDIIGLLNKIPGVEIPKFKKKTVKGVDDTAKEVGKSASKIDDSYKNLSAGVSGYLGNINTSLDGTKSKMDSMERKASTTSSNSRTSFSSLNVGVSGYLSGVNTSIDGTKDKMDSMSSKASGTLLSTSGSFSTLSSNLYNSLSGVNGSLGNTKFNMGLFQDAAENMRRGTSNSFSTMASNASAYLGSTGGSFNGLKGKVDNTNGSLSTFKWYANQSYRVGISSWGFSGVKSSIDGIVRSLDDLFKYNNKRFNITTGTKYMGYQSLLDRAPHFASGGFPEEGPFYMNRGEIVGKFSNGKTAVANNQQITEGIKQAVMEGMAQVMMNSNAGGNPAPIIENVFKCDSETLYRMTQVGKAKHGQRYIVANEFG